MGCDFKSIWQQCTGIQGLQLRGKGYWILLPEMMSFVMFFAGVGPIALAAAKKVKRVYANDLNPQAVEYMERNSVLNKLERKVQVFNMDGRRFTHAMFTSSKAESITQVVMNLPGDAAEFLDVFKGIYRDSPKDGKFTFPTIQFMDSQRRKIQNSTLRSG